MKQCSKCGVTQVGSEFGKDARNVSGLQSYCKSCDRARARAYHAANLEASRKRCRTWAAKHPDKINGYTARRRARKRNASVGLTAVEFEQIAEIYRIAQLATGFAISANRRPHHVDHIQALAAGGFHRADNLQVLPEALNTRKHTRTHAELLEGDPEYRAWIEGKPTFEQVSYIVQRYGTST